MRSKAGPKNQTGRQLISAPGQDENLRQDKATEAREDDDKANHTNDTDVRKQERCDMSGNQINTTTTLEPKGYSCKKTSQQVEATMTRSKVKQVTKSRNAKVEGQVPQKREKQGQTVRSKRSQKAHEADISVHESEEARPHEVRVQESEAAQPQEGAKMKKRKLSK